MNNPAIARHPKGTKARILLSSVFGPFARDDEFGSRRINPMELYQNQVTRLQGGFSLRMFHRSFGLLMLQANIEAPCTVLDFPTLESFTNEIRRTPYDIVGIGAIGPNVEKVKAMCAIIRHERPGATIIVGGHVASRQELPEIIDADHIVRGDGIAWFRRFLGQDESCPSGIPRFSQGSDHASWASTCRRGKAIPPPSSSPLSGAPSVATSAPLQRCSEARETS